MALKDHLEGYCGEVFDDIKLFQFLHINEVSERVDERAL